MRIFRLSIREERHDIHIHSDRWMEIRIRTYQLADKQHGYTHCKIGNIFPLFSTNFTETYFKM